MTEATPRKFVDAEAIAQGWEIAPQACNEDGQIVVHYVKDGTVIDCIWNENGTLVWVSRRKDGIELIALHPWGAETAVAWLDGREVSQDRAGPSDRL